MNYCDISKEWMDYATRDFASARELYSSCEHLNDFSVQTRYPTDYELSEKDVPVALRNAGEIFDYVKAKLAE